MKLKDCIRFVFVIIILPIVGLCKVIAIDIDKYENQTIFLVTTSNTGATASYEDGDINSLTALVDLLTRGEREITNRLSRSDKPLLITPTSTMEAMVARSTKNICHLSLTRSFIFSEVDCTPHDDALTMLRILRI